MSFFKFCKEERKSDRFDTEGDEIMT